MGKTSLLKNIGRLLPTTLIPLYVYIDLQGPPSRAKDEAGFFYWIAQSFIVSARERHNLTLPSLTREQLVSEPFTIFTEWLDEVEVALDVKGSNMVLLALDEYEELDQVIAKGRLDEADILGALRHIIQHRPRFKILVAGSHTLEELPRWANYLINTHMIQISYLDTAAARQLIEHPVENFALSYEPDASQRVLELTRGHPYLTQLLCDQIINLKNEQPSNVRRIVRLADVETAIPHALNFGSPFFVDIGNQISSIGVALLSFLAAQGEGVGVSQEEIIHQFEIPDSLEQTLALLNRRELIEQVNGNYCFQVELIRRYFSDHTKP